MGETARSLRQEVCWQEICVYVFQRIILELLRVAMVGIPNTKGFIVDGFPREMEQGKEFENEVSKALFTALEMFVACMQYSWVV